MTESESVALPLGDTPVIIYAVFVSAFILYHAFPKKSIAPEIFFYFNYYIILKNNRNHYIIVIRRILL